MKSDQLRNKLGKLHEPAFGWAMVCCGRDREMSVEVLQKAYLRILSGDAVYRKDSSFSTWVFGVIRIVALEQLRIERRNRALFRPENLEAGIGVADSAGVTLEQRELVEELHQALRRLSKRQREVLHLVFYQNMTIQQAAETLEISIGSARQHYQRGKTKLEQKLSNHREPRH